MDKKNKIPRAMLDIISKRARPRQWANYITASTVIKLYNNSDTRIAEELCSNIYINDRQPRRGSFIDKSRRRAGRQKLTNRLQIFRKIDFDWTEEISSDRLRQNLKRLFINFNTVWVTETLNHLNLRDRDTCDNIKVLWLLLLLITFTWQLLTNHPVIF